MTQEAIARIQRNNPPLAGYRAIDVDRIRARATSRDGPLTADRLRELLHYNPLTGVFTWRIDRMRVRAGDKAGKKTKDGYIHIGIDGRRYQAHRLAFLYMTGVIPSDYIDHKNLSPSDNRWENLRVATNSQNQMNTSMKSNNTSGYKGVSWHKSKGRWRVDVRLGGKKTFIGYFDTPEDGHAAYSAAVTRHHGDYARVA